MSDDALEEDIHPSLSLPDFCPVPVCFNVRERAFRAVDVPQNAININTLEFVDCLREAGAEGSNPLTPTNLNNYLATAPAATDSALIGVLWDLERVTNSAACMCFRG